MDQAILSTCRDTVRHSDFEATVCFTWGCLYGRVLSTLLWTLVVHDLLARLPMCYWLHCAGICWRLWDHGWRWHESACSCYLLLTCLRFSLTNTDKTKPIVPFSEYRVGFIQSRHWELANAAKFTQLTDQVGGYSLWVWPVPPEILDPVDSLPQSEGLFAVTYSITIIL